MDTSRIVVYSPQDVRLFEIAPSDVFSFNEYEEVNGQHYLTLNTSAHLEKEQRILTFDATGKVREYVVGEENSNHFDGTYKCPWSLQHDMSVTTVSEMVGTQVPVTAAIALDAALSGTDRWVRGTVTQVTTGGASMYQMSGWKALSTLVETWGGEIDANITVDGYGVISRKVDLLSHIGSETAKRRFDYSKDMRGVNRRVGQDPVAVRIIPRGKGEQVGNGYGRKITIESVNGGVSWLQNDVTAQLYRLPSGNGGYEYPTIYVDNQSIDDPQELKDWGLSVLEAYTTPVVTYEIDVTSVEETGEGLHGVGLGDEVQCVDTDFGGIDLRLTGRVTARSVDRLNEANTKLTIGNASTKSLRKSGMSNVLGRIKKLLEGQESTAEYLNAIIDNLNAEINATGGYFYITDGQGIRTYDTAVSDPLVGSEASKVVEIKGGSMRIADSKTAQGEWDWKTVFVSGHIAAALVTAVAVTAGYIGSVASGNYWDLDNGTLQMAASTKIGGKTAAKIASDAVDAQTQTDVFNKLTNNGETQGIYMSGGKVYINATYMNTGHIGSVASGNYWDLDNGTLQMAASTQIGGQTASAIASDAASSAVNGQTQSFVFNKLTNNGQTQGIYMSSGKVYLNASYIKTGTMQACTIQSSSGDSYWNLDTGVMQLLSYGANLTIGRKDSSGLKSKITLGDSMTYETKLGGLFYVQAGSVVTYQGVQYQDAQMFIGDSNGVRLKVSSNKGVADPYIKVEALNGYLWLDGVGNKEVVIGASSSAQTYIGSGTLYASGDVSCHSLTQRSDRRSKDHLGYIDGEDAAEFVRSLKPVVFAFKRDGKRHMGFYAQDVQEADLWDTVTVAEEMDEEDGYKPLTLEYQALMAPLVAYCQQLERRIDSQQDIIEKLVARVEALEAR